MTTFVAQKSWLSPFDVHQQQKITGTQHHHKLVLHSSCHVQRVLVVATKDLGGGNTMKTAYFLSEEGEQQGACEGFIIFPIGTNKPTTQLTIPFGRGMMNAILLCGGVVCLLFSLLMTNKR